MGPPPAPPKVIGLAGPSCAGKGTVAAALAAALGSPCLHLCMDSFYLDLAEMRGVFGAEPNWDHPDSLDWPLLLRAVGRLREGLETRVPVYDFATHSRLADFRVAQPAPFIIFEGLWLGHEPTLAGMLDLLVFLDVPPEVALARRVDRDLGARGRERGDVERQFHSQVEPMRRMFVEPQRSRADLVLDGTLDADALAGEIARRLGGPPDPEPSRPRRFH